MMLRLLHHHAMTRMFRNAHLFSVMLLLLHVCTRKGVVSALHLPQQPSASSSSSWLPLPHHHNVARRNILAKGATAVTASSLVAFGAGGKQRMARAAAADDDDDDNNNKQPGSKGGAYYTDGFRSVATVESAPVIPVWPTWGGGRVVPVSLGGGDDGLLHDPFLLLAHHKHWFDPRDPFREPFKMAGKALGLPYVDVEGFSMHPHRGFDILTYILDGSDGFRHRDSLGIERIYRGGCAQWMRTGSGVLHEEFWETRPDRRTSIELFQLWINLPASQKFDEPVVHYIGTSTDNPWNESVEDGGVRVRDIGTTLDASLFENDKSVAQRRPPVTIQHVSMDPGTEWVARAPTDHSAVLYVREGSASFESAGGKPNIAKSLQTVTFHTNGDSIFVQNAERRRTLDFLFLTGKPLREPVAFGGPIVMNTREELDDAFRQLSNGTFLQRNIVLREHEETIKR